MTDDEHEQLMQQVLTHWTTDSLMIALAKAQAQRFERVQTILRELRTLYGPTADERRLGVELTRRGVVLNEVAHDEANQS